MISTLQLFQIAEVILWVMALLSSFHFTSNTVKGMASPKRKGFDRIVPNAPFLYPLKTSESRKVF